jgi:hypothetical protein
MGHYPFSKNFTLGCGGPELGSVLDIGAMSELKGAGTRNPREPAGAVDKVSTEGTALHVVGWATGVDDPVRCAVLTDETGVVLGSGPSRLHRSDIARSLIGVSPDTGFKLIAPTTPNSRVVLILESGAMHWLAAQTGA